MKSLIIRMFWFSIAALLSDCTGNRFPKQGDDDFNSIETCRNQWQFKDLTDTTELRILSYDKKGRYDMSTWPNFFIGVDSKGDTIGVVDDFAKEDFRKGVKLSFVPHDYGDNVVKALSLYPIFKFIRKKELNGLYCAVRNVYYGRLNQ